MISPKKKWKGKERKGSIFDFQLYLINKDNKPRTTIEQEENEN